MASRALHLVAALAGGSAQAGARPLPLLLLDPIPSNNSNNSTNATSPPPPSPSPCAGTFVYSVNGTAAPASLPVSALVATIAANSGAASLNITLCEGTVLDASALGVSSSPLLNLMGVVGSFTLGCAVAASPPACAIDGGGVYQLVLVGQSGGSSVVLASLELRNGAALVGGAVGPGGVQLASLELANGFSSDVSVRLLGEPKLNVSGDLFDGNRASVRPHATRAALRTAHRLSTRVGGKQGSGGALYFRYISVDASGATFVNNSAGIDERACAGPLKCSFPVSPTRCFFGRGAFLPGRRDRSANVSLFRRGVRNLRGQQRGGRASLPEAHTLSCPRLG